MAYTCKNTKSSADFFNTSLMTPLERYNYYTKCIQNNPICPATPIWQKEQKQALHLINLDKNKISNLEEEINKLKNENQKLKDRIDSIKNL